MKLQQASLADRLADDACIDLRAIVLRASSFSQEPTRKQADEVCNFPGSTTMVDPVAVRPFPRPRKLPP
jgi:hypothetical protein